MAATLITSVSLIFELIIYFYSILVRRSLIEKNNKNYVKFLLDAVDSIFKNVSELWEDKESFKKSKARFFLIFPPVFENC